MELMNEFPNSNGQKSSTNRLMKKLKDTGSVNKFTGSGRPQSAALKNMLTICF